MRCITARMLAALCAGPTSPEEVDTLPSELKRQGYARSLHRFRSAGRRGRAEAECAGSRTPSSAVQTLRRYTNPAVLALEMARSGPPTRGSSADIEHVGMRALTR